MDRSGAPVRACTRNPGFKWCMGRIPYRNEAEILLKPLLDTFGLIILKISETKLVLSFGPLDLWGDLRTQNRPFYILVFFLKLELSARLLFVLLSYIIIPLKLNIHAFHENAI